MPLVVPMRVRTPIEVVTKHALTLLAVGCLHFFHLQVLLVEALSSAIRVLASRDGLHGDEGRRR